MSAISSKLDAIMSAIKNKADAKPEKPPTQEELDEEKLKELTADIEEIVELILDGDTRETIQSKIDELQSHLEMLKNESRPLMRVWHKKGGKKFSTPRRNSHMLDLSDAYEKKMMLEKYPDDLHHMLHVKTREKLELLERKMKRAKHDKKD